MEPPRIKDIKSLDPAFAKKVTQLLANMNKLGFDPMIFEAKRTKERQRWLYGVGRTHSMGRKPVTWTLKSNHFDGKAVDIVSHSRLWNHPKFFARLKQEANKLGLYTLRQEACHIQAAKP